MGIKGWSRLPSKERAALREKYGGTKGVKKAIKSGETITLDEEEKSSYFDKKTGTVVDPTEPEGVYTTIERYRELEEQGKIPTGDTSVSISKYDQYISELIKSGYTSSTDIETIARVAEERGVSPTELPSEEISRVVGSSDTSYRVETLPSGERRHYFMTPEGVVYVDLPYGSKNVILKDGEVKYKDPDQETEYIEEERPPIRERIEGRVQETIEDPYRVIEEFPEAIGSAMLRLPTYFAETLTPFRIETDVYTETAAGFKALSAGEYLSMRFEKMAPASKAISIGAEFLTAGIALKAFTSFKPVIRTASIEKIQDKSIKGVAYSKDIRPSWLDRGTFKTQFMAEVKKDTIRGFTATAKTAKPSKVTYGKFVGQNVFTKPMGGVTYSEAAGVYTQFAKTTKRGVKFLPQAKVSKGMTKFVTKGMEYKPTAEMGFVRSESLTATGISGEAAGVRQYIPKPTEEFIKITGKTTLAKPTTKAVQTAATQAITKQQPLQSIKETVASKVVSKLASKPVTRIQKPITSTQVKTLDKQVVKPITAVKVATSQKLDTKVSARTLQKTKITQVQKEMQLTKTAQITKLKTTPITAIIPAITPTLKPKTALAQPTKILQKGIIRTISPTKPVTPLPVQPVPPHAPFVPAAFLFNFQKPTITKREKYFTEAKPTYKYRPSLVGISFNIKSYAPPSSALTGVEIRPILQGLASESKRKRRGRSSIKFELPKLTI